MKQIIIGDVLSQAWELTKKHWATVLVCMIGVYIIQAILSSLTGGMSALDLAQITKLQESIAQNPNDPEFAISQFGQLYTNILPRQSALSYLTQIISMILAVGVSQTLLNCGRGNGDFSINAWKQPATLYVKIIVTQIIVGIIVGIGFLLCVLPGIYLHARLSYCTYYFLDHKDAGIDKALAASWNMTQESALNLSLLQVIYFFMYIAGFLCCCIGVVVPAIVAALATVVCYLTLTPDVPQAESTEITE